ncbi:hypothetical protein PPACK8108_LOCUS23401 [Phakopsora pachyrhizi]|uniref:Uncharacterized protein n=1 Tax=Phakopsora pachyrhizi TaxID=170000 RepID=A0AAV0BP55_PHAPC|nr:hypothetical protein PPACK8108_LOCUS23401 [Phakopsora pachyrhizi]
MMFGQPAVLPVDVEMETYLKINWEEVRTTEELLTGRMDQLARKKEVLELGYKRMMEATAKLELDGTRIARGFAAAKIKRFYSWGIAPRTRRRRGGGGVIFLLLVLLGYLSTEGIRRMDMDGTGEWHGRVTGCSGGRRSWTGDDGEIIRAGGGVVEDLVKRAGKKKGRRVLQGFCKEVFAGFCRALRRKEW